MVVALIKKPRLYPLWLRFRRQRWPWVVVVVVVVVVLSALDVTQVEPLLTTGCEQDASLHMECVGVCRVCDACRVCQPPVCDTCTCGHRWLCRALSSPRCSTIGTGSSSACLLAWALQLLGTWLACERACMYRLLWANSWAAMRLRCGVVDTSVVLMKTALEMTVVGPVMITAMPAWNAWWTGMSWTDFVAKWKRDTLHAWLIGMCAFAPAGLLNYAFVPVRYVYFAL